MSALNNELTVAITCALVRGSTSKVTATAFSAVVVGYHIHQNILDVRSRRIRSLSTTSRVEKRAETSHTSLTNSKSMIIDKQLPPEDLTPTDPPPSYDSYDRLSIPNSQDNKYNLVDHPVASGSHSPLHSPSALSPKTPTSATGSINKGKGRAGVNWFRFNSAETRTAREVRNTVLGLVRDLIQEHNIAAAAGILQSCSDACASRDLSLSSILQEKSIENHTPLYWAIVKRPPDEHHEVEDTQGVDLLTALISYATPLNQQTIAEIRLACLVTSDQALFQRLRLSPEFAPVSKVDQMLLGATIPPEDVELEDMAGEGGGAFAVNFVIPQFHKRMVVSKEIALEFIARSVLSSFFSCVF